MDARRRRTGHHPQQVRVQAQPRQRYDREAHTKGRHGVTNWFGYAGDCGITIYDVSLADNGNWQCQVTAVVVGQQTLQSETINLLVLISPERPNIRRTVSPSSRDQRREENVHEASQSDVRNYRQHPYTPELQVLANQDSPIECTVANGNPAPKISWLLNGRNISDHVSHG